MSLESVWAHILTIGQCKCLTICKLVLIIFAVICLLITFTDLKLNLLKKTRISRTITGMSTKTETGEVGKVLETTMLQRYKAAMVLSGVGDAIAFNRGNWEFCEDGTRIHGELFQMGGLKKIDVSEDSNKRHRRWIVSDDTVMHLATAEALIQSGKTKDLQEMYYNIGKKYHECMSDMRDRAPGDTCKAGASQWVDDKTSRTAVKFLPRSGGCGAAMRAMCIGLRYPREEDESMLIKASVESGRMSHHHPTGYLGALAAALFTAYSVQGKEIEKWGHDLMKVLPKAQEYVIEAGIEVEKNMKAWEGEKSFVKYWERYLKERNISDGKSQPVYPSVFGVKERDDFYERVSFSGWGGSSGHDAPMIAYDGLLAAKDNWTELANRSFFHGGDSDSTAVMAGCWFGALYGLKGVPKSNYKGLEYESRLEKAGEELYKLSHPENIPEKVPVIPEAHI